MDKSDLYSAEKNKAIDLFNKFWEYNRDNELESCVNDPKWHVVNLCNIAIDEIISACEYNDADTFNTDWWNRVREELEKL